MGTIRWTAHSMAASTPGISGTPVAPALPRQAVEAVVALARKTVRQRLLIFRQHVDSKVSCVAESVDDGDRVAQADQDQRRVQRHRSESSSR